MKINILGLFIILKSGYLNEKNNGKIIISQAMSQTSVCGALPFGGGSHVLLSTFNLQTLEIYIWSTEISSDNLLIFTNLIP
ncbi:uncharacterized protein OCT59_023909 [Rhizophagus irregularis]|uniref:uncharacterized protein n=1 Tax=Rhizophagus irregularis TaxID=588596 RepID=UPI0033297B67|nr:hypothetical protein OCT59_023909 [Rhizophagus irregularis]